MLLWWWRTSLPQLVYKSSTDTDCPNVFSSYLWNENVFLKVKSQSLSHQLGEAGRITSKQTEAEVGGLHQQKEERWRSGTSRGMKSERRRGPSRHSESRWTSEASARQMGQVRLACRTQNCFTISNFRFSSKCFNCQHNNSSRFWGEKADWPQLSSYNFKHPLVDKQFHKRLKHIWGGIWIKADIFFLH